MGKWGKSFPDGEFGAAGRRARLQLGCDRLQFLCEELKQSSHKGYCANRARANPAKGAKGKMLAFKEGTGLCTPCVTKRDTGRTSQKCYCGSARSYKQRKPAQEKRVKPKQGPSPPMPSVASTHARPTPSALDRMHRCEPALGRSFPAECALAPPGASSDEEEKEEQLPSIRKVSGGVKVGFFHDFGDGVEEGELGVQGAGTLAFEEGTGLCTQLATKRMHRAMTTEQRSRTAGANRTMEKDKYELLCQKAGVPPSEELRRYFNMGVPAGRMKADRNIVLCVPDGPCYADAAARRAGKEVKRQPRIHHASCMYKQLELVQQQQGGR